MERVLALCEVLSAKSKECNPVFCGLNRDARVLTLLFGNLDYVVHGNVDVSRANGFKELAGICDDAVPLMLLCLFASAARPYIDGCRGRAVRSNALPEGAGRVFQSEDLEGPRAMLDERFARAAGHSPAVPKRPGTEGADFPST